MENAPKIRSFRDLHAWQNAHKVVLEIYKLTKKFPREELFGLSIQMRRAAVSITSNIAEGFSRTSNREKVQFYSISQGSTSELQNQLILAHDLGYIKSDLFNLVLAQTYDVSKIVNGLMRTARTNTIYKIRNT